MKIHLLIVLLAFSTLALAQNDAPKISTRMTGTFADSTFSINGYVAHISVSQDTSSGLTLLIYNYVFSSPDGSSTFEFGGGYIPNDAVQLNNANVAKLNVDTSQVSGFMATSCTHFPGQSSTCTPGPFGVIQIDWQQDGVMSNRTISQNWKTFPGARLHTQLNSELNSAHVTGSFLGSTFISDLGDIGKTTNSLFEIFDN